MKKILLAFVSIIISIVVAVMSSSLVDRLQETIDDIVENELDSMVQGAVDSELDKLETEGSENDDKYANLLPISLGNVGSGDAICENGVITFKSNTYSPSLTWDIKLSAGTYAMEIELENEDYLSSEVLNQFLAFNCGMDSDGSTILIYSPKFCDVYENGLTEFTIGSDVEGFYFISSLSGFDSVTFTIKLYEVMENKISGSYKVNESIDLSGFSGLKTIYCPTYTVGDNLCEAFCFSSEYAAFLVKDGGELAFYDGGTSSFGGSVIDFGSEERYISTTLYNWINANMTKQ